MERLFPKEHQGTLRNPKEPWGTSRNNYNTQTWVKERNDRQKKVMRRLRLANKNNLVN